MLLVLVFRWCAFAWMAIVAAIGGQVREQAATLAVAALVLTLGWTAWLTLAAVRRSDLVLAIDLALAVALVLAGGLFHPVQHVLTNHPSVTGAYPMAAVAAWAVVRRVSGGVLAGGIVAAVLPFAYELNRASVAELSFSQTLAMTASGLSYVLVGAAVGTASTQFDRLAQALARSSSEAARLAEGERLAARIHDDVLQHLALLQRKGLDLASRGDVRPGEVRALMAEVRAQEKALRDLVVPGALVAPPGSASLTAFLEQLPGSYGDLEVLVLASGPVVMPEIETAEVVAAVKEALTNVVKHAKATQAWVSVFDEDPGTTVFVRDNGVGFTFVEDAAMAAGRLGLLVSVRARIERIGGTVAINGRPGRGAEIELRLP